MERGEGKGRLVDFDYNSNTYKVSGGSKQGGKLRRRLTVENIKADLCLSLCLPEMLCESICVCACVCFCVCVYVGGCSSQSTRPSTRVGCLCGEVWTNVLLQISKITVIRNSFLFASYSLLHPPPHTEVFFMPHVDIDVVCVSVCAFVWVCCVFYSLALYSKWCPAASCVSCVHQLVWSACLRRFLLLFTGRGIGIEHWNRPDRNSTTDRHMSNANAHSVCPSVHTLSTWKSLLCELWKQAKSCGCFSQSVDAGIW